MNDDGSIPLRFLASNTTSVDTGDLVLQILLVVLLIFLNAFFDVIFREMRYRCRRQRVRGAELHPRAFCI